MKFLVIWKIELSLLSPHVASAVARMQAYAKPLERSGRIAARYHIVGAHGGAWVYDVGLRGAAVGTKTGSLPPLAWRGPEVAGVF